jgi:hypothetical protein
MSCCEPSIGLLDKLLEPLYHLRHRLMKGQNGPGMNQKSG